MRSRSTKRDTPSKSSVPGPVSSTVLAQSPAKYPEPSPILPEDTSFTYPKSYAQTEPLTKPHTITVLVLLVFAFGYALFTHKHVDEKDQDKNNIARGLIGAVALGLVFCAEHLRDTLFVRPHPAIWRLVTGIGLFYAMALAFALFQNLQFLRSIMEYLDPEWSGKALPEKSYASDCTFSFTAMWNALDEFIIAHLLGWAFKAAMIRDVRISFLVSFLFELMEYTFTYLQPNFAECWWDHWILDFAICNTGGMLIGHAVLSWLDSREYNWVGISDIPTVRGKLARFAQQFTPYSYTRYDWRVFEDIKRFGCVVFMVVGIMICELDAFFLKFILYVQPRSPLNVYRLLIWWAVGMVALRDYYAFITDPRIKRLGSTCWVVLAILIMELAVVVKFGYTLPEWQGKYPPTDVIATWTMVLLIGTGVAVYWFFFRSKSSSSAVSGSSNPTSSYSTHKKSKTK